METLRTFCEHSELDILLCSHKNFNPRPNPKSNNKVKNLIYLNFFTTAPNRK